MDGFFSKTGQAKIQKIQEDADRAAKEVRYGAVHAVIRQ